MGIGNLQGVLRLYGDDDAVLRPRLLRLDARPATPTCQRRLASFGDDSSNYLWKLHAAREIMRLYRTDRGAARAPAGAPDGEELGRGGAAPARLDARASPTPTRCARRRTTATIRAFPDDPAVTGLARDARHGRARRAGRRRAGLYRGLRPEALAMALYIGAQTRALQRAPGAADRDLDRARRGLPAAARARATARRRGTTRCTRPAGPSTSRAPTARSARRSRSSSCSTGSRSSTRSPGCASPARSTSRPPAATRPCCRCSSGSTPRRRPRRGSRSRLGGRARSPRPAPRRPRARRGRRRPARGRASAPGRRRRARAAGRGACVAHVGPIDPGTNTSKRGTGARGRSRRRRRSSVEFLNAGVSTRPTVSSVLTMPGITTEISTPVPRSSARTASESPTTPCLVAQ